MPDFAYTARTSTGQPVSGTIAAASLSEALRLLRAEGKFPVSVQPAGAARPAAAPSGSRGLRISRADLIQFSTQLSIMVDTGVTLSEALDCIARQAHKPQVKALVSDILERVQGGASLSEAMSRHPRSFPPVYLALVKASEKSGLLGKLLNRATAYLRDELETIRRVKGALTYPAIMFGFALTTTVFLLAFVLPRFTVIYSTKQAALPVPTRALMAASDFIVSQWPALLVCIGGLIAASWLFLRTDTGRRAWHYVQLHMPILGSLYRKVHLARGLRTVGTMAGAGVSLMDCVSTARDLCPNSYFRELWQNASDQIQTGKQLSDPLFDSPLVPRSVAQMIFSGEKSGRLATVMEQIAAYAEQELKDQIAGLTRYIEPAMIVLMGIIIGGICLALLLPIFTISKVMGH